MIQDKEKFVTKEQLDKRFADHVYTSADVLDSQIGFLKRQIGYLENRLDYVMKIMVKKGEEEKT